jgi:O-6-methylguanine DNA methyltransferase
MVNETVIHGCRTTKIYCRPDCRPGRRTKPENRVYFQSVKEARTNGYRACKVCRPDEGPETLFLTRYSSPLGTYILISSQMGVCYLLPEDDKDYFVRWQRNGVKYHEDSENNRTTVTELDAYFAGKIRQFTVPIDLRGTNFQRQVWEKLCGIPYGETRSYGQIAYATGWIIGARAVGQAIGRNPISIIVPCHRVIGSNGSLTGYGGGLPRKIALLKLEKAL